MVNDKPLTLQIWSYWLSTYCQLGINLIVNYGVFFGIASIDSWWYFFQN